MDISTQPVRHATAGTFKAPGRGSAIGDCSAVGYQLLGPADEREEASSGDGLGPDRKLGTVVTFITIGSHHFSGGIERNDPKIAPQATGTLMAVGDSQLCARTSKRLSPMVASAENVPKGRRHRRVMSACVHAP